MKYMREQERNTCTNHLNCTHRLTSKNLVQRCSPKQAHFNKILKIIQRKVLKRTHLPFTVKEIQAGYLIIPYFKDVYLYLACNKLQQHKA